MWTPEPLSREQIEARANKLLVQPLVDRVGKDHLIRKGLRFEELYSLVIWPRFRISLHEALDLSHLSDGKNKVLGAYFPLSNEACIDQCLAAEEADPRRTFTLYHEVCGHGVLQGQWLRTQMGMPGRPPCVVETEETILLRNTARLEWQANAMAGFAAAPLWLVRMQIAHRLKPTHFFRFTGPGRYFIGGRSTRPFEVMTLGDLAQAIASQIQPYFDGLSKQALGYRVLRSGLLRDETSNRRALLRVA